MSSKRILHFSFSFCHTIAMSDGTAPPRGLCFGVFCREVCVRACSLSFCLSRGSVCEKKCVPLQA